MKRISLNKMNFKNLCLPALVYLILNAIWLIFISLSAVNHPEDLCDWISKGLVSGKCSTTSVIMYFAIKLFYLYLIVMVLQVLCKQNYNMLAWFCVLIGLTSLEFGTLAFVLFFNPDSKINMSSLNDPRY